MKPPSGSARQPNPYSKHQPTEKRHVNGTVEISGKVEANLEPSLVAEYKFNNHTTGRLEHQRFGLEILTFFSVLAVLILNVVQTKQLIRSTNSSISAAETAKDSLALSRKEFESSQAAVLQPIVSIRGQYIQVDVLNVGHRPATKIDSVIRFSYRAGQSNIRLPQTITERATASEYPSGFVSRTILFQGSIDKESNARIDVPIRYWNGIEAVDAVFSLCPVFSPYGSAPVWQDCENQEAYQQR